MENKNKMLFFEEWFEIIDCYEEPKDKLLFLTSLLKYGLSGEKPDDNFPKYMKPTFISLRQKIDSLNNKYRELTNKRSEAGKKGMYNRWQNNSYKFTKEDEEKFKICFQLWNSITDNNINKIQRISDDRRKALYFLLQKFTTEDFNTVINKINDSEYLRGKNKSLWAVSFDWIIKESNFIKVLEGNFNNRNKNINDVWK